MKFKVLVFPCGSQMAIDINFSLRHALQIELFGASSVEDHGKYVYRNYIGGLPNIAEQHFIQHFNKVLQEQQINFIIPTHDTVALFLKEHESELTAKVITADLETVRTCRYKSLTYKQFSNYPFVPTVYSQIQDVNEFPVFLKPDDGQGGQGTVLVNNKEELKFHLSKTPNLLVCEYLPGKEISIDCFTDQYGILRMISPYTRDRTLAGVSVHSTLESITDEINNIAHILNKELSFRGHWFFQMKQDKTNKYKLLEVSSRMSADSILTVGRGINLALLSILDFAELDITIERNDYAIEIDRSFTSRYTLGITYERVYIDLDHTLIVDNKINTQLLMFLYQCVNKHIELILVTTNKDIIYETLQKYHIHPTLFSKIVQMNHIIKEVKYEQLNKKAIFIHNIFAKQSTLHNQLNIPSFDVHNIECLIDWRA
ncbi:ATP-grasp domain-containing protein [Bacillus fungorum]|uniref:ATP-grasp domain-containing protein n=1 Tax=Bacillus fungorum TaxID=2039284 RepID=UPI003395C965